MKLATAIACISTMALVAIGNAYACDCRLTSAAKDAPVTTIIFKGFATEGPSDLSQGADYYNFSPTTIYKGDQKKSIIVYSPRDTCGQFFQKNTEYMVFASEYKGNISEYKGKLLTNICSSWPISARNSSNTKEVEEYFNKNKNK